jgi:hypothetical protein
MTIHSTAVLRTVKPISLLALAILMLLVALVAGAQPASAQIYPNPQYQGPGQFCVDDAGFPNGANCTANDTRISRLTPDIAQACTAVGDIVSVDFVADLVIGATTRYDLAMYIATDGGDAEIGNSCYKDVLQPVAALNAAGNPTNPAGTGPFKNEDSDLCGEANQTVGAVYKLQQTLQVVCVDDDNDGVVDPISTCLSWANNANQFSCQGVIALEPGPGTSSKCNCESIAPNPPVLVYRGYDFGDLPDTFGTTKAQSGAQHAVQDVNNDGTPGAQGGVPAVWLGGTEDFGPNGETDGQPSANADGDDINLVYPGITPSDENGVQFPGPWYYNIPNGGKATVVVSASDPNACAGNKCHVGFWINWDGNTSFNTAAYPSGEYYVQPVTVGTNNLTFPVPQAWTAPLYARFRLYYEPTGVQGSYLPTGLAINGEVEDYSVTNSPAAVALASFAASCQAETPVISWETVSEIDTAGFNVWRGDSAGAPEIQLNASMIPAHPGSTQGYSYSWTDTTALPDRTYFYWLEDLDINGVASMTGPIEATCTSPTAVTVDRLQANSSTGSPAIWWIPLIALVAGIVLAGTLSRRSLAK